MEKLKMDLAFFGEEGAGAPAAAAESAGSAETAEAGAAQAAETIPQAKPQYSPRVAAEIERQKRVHGAKAAAQPQAQVTQQVDAQADRQPDSGAQNAEAELQARWEAAKKGEFAKFYGQDVQAAVKDRLKNRQAEDNELAGYRSMEPALKVLRERAGVETNEELMKQIMDDDSIYEDAANEAGMTVPAYREFLKFKEEHDQHVREAEEQQNREAIGQHYMKLTKQAEEMKAQFPNFNLDAELQNPDFLKLTSPAIGLSVEDAYFAVHHKELGPQMMAYGMQRAKNQMAQSIMAKGARPREGGLDNRNAAADMTMNFKAMDRKERNAVYAAIHAGRKR